MSTEQEYVTADIGLAAFLIYVLSENYFLGAEKREVGRHCQFVFANTCPGNSCQELARLYHSGAELRNVKEYAECHKLIANAMRGTTKGLSGARYRGF
jgi:hypothetical protein